MKKHICILIIFLIALTTLTTVNATENVTDDLISQTPGDEILQSDDEYINNNQNLEFKLNVSESTDYENTGNLTFNVYFNGTLTFGPMLYDFEKNPIIIYKNNQKIGNIPVNQINYTTFKPGTYNVFNATFTQHIDDKTQIKVYYTVWNSNTLIIEKISDPTINALNTDSITIINKENIINSDNTWKNSIDYLKKAINLAENNAKIQLNNINIQTIPIFTNSTKTETININKNLKITGKNATINVNENSHLFNINSNTTFENIKFTNASSYIFINNANLTFINCTFTDSYGRIINNTGKLNIINSTFKNMEEYYKNPQISNLKDYYQEVGLIHNTGTLNISNTKFDNFEYPKEIEIDNQIIKELGIIYNLNNATIINSNFTNLNSRAINNTGTLKIENSLFENITTNTLKIIIDSKDFKKIGNSIIYQSYNGFRQQSTDQTITDQNYFINGGGIYNKGNINISKSQFNNIESYYGGAIYNEKNMNIKNSTFTSTTSSGGMGGAIYNNNNMIIENTIINKSKTNLFIITELNPSGSIKFYILQSHGGAIYNKQTLTINNSTITQSSARYGGAITNNGILKINNSTFDKNQITENGHSPTLFNDENGECEIYNSLIKNTNIKTSEIGGGGAFRFYMGTIYNTGKLLITKTIFDNITGIYEALTQWSGTFTILNYGTLNATYNYFINSPHKVNPDKYIFHDYVIDDVYTYAFTNSIKNVNMNNNYYCLNSDPHTIDTNFPVEDYFILRFENEYYALNLNENRNILLKLELASGKEFNNYELLPNIPLTINTYDENGNPINITTTLTNGKASIPFNCTTSKGSYIIKAEMGGGKCNTTIDVGKANATMNMTKNNIHYKQDALFKINITAPTTPTGNITLKLNNTKYTKKLDENGNCIFNISNLTVGNYTLKIVYEGDDNYFKIFYYDNYTVSKYPTNLSMSIPEIYYGNNGIITIKLDPTDITVYTHLYVNGEYDRQKMIKDTGTITLKGFNVGKYNLTLCYKGDEYYEAVNASAIFIVKKYESNLTINTSDITVGETAYLNVTLTPEGEVAGEANLTINNKTETIYLKNGNNTIKLENLTGGTYNITIFFPGDKKYTNATATTTLNVKKHNTTIKATINDNEITVKVNPSNATGTVNLYINDQLQKLNLTNGQATFTPKYNKFNNSIFIYYEGDEYYNYTTYNTNYEYNKLANLTAYDVLTYDGEKGTIYVTLTDEAGYGIANKNITITINNKKYTRTTNQSGTATLTLTLPIGNYTYTSAYAKTTVKNTFTVVKNINLTSVGDLEVYDKETFQYYVKLTDGRNNNIIGAEVTFKINGQTYTNKTNNNGIARIFLNLNKGNYTITATYKTETVKNKITVRENDNYTITAKDLEMYYRDGSTFNITLKDGNGNTLSGRIITFTINKNIYTRTTNANGVASLTINLPAGRYEIKTTYLDTSITNKITIKDYPPVITGSDIEMYYRDGTNYTVTLKDTKGNILVNKEVIFTVDDENYTRLTNKDGIASITINLPEGIYEITATYKNVSTTNKITIKDYPPVITGSDIEMYYRDGTNYTITLKNTKGTPLVNVDVTFNINNRNYTRTTDSNGIARITINLPEGTYTIKATYKNASTTNKITIKNYPPVITGKDIEMYYHDGTNYTITLKNTKGTALANKEVIFNINNRNYTRTTDSNGIARITINLPEGTYTIKATYKNASTTNKITIKNYPPVITGKDIEMYYGDGTNYTITLKNTKGEILSNKIITFTITRKDYNRTTNNKGEASVTINLPAGTYEIKATYQNISTTNKIIVKEYPPVLTTEDLEMYFHDNSTFKATLTNTNGDVLTNRKVTFTIGNETYTGTTNNQGVASIAINLAPGNYTIKTAYQNLTKTNNIEIRTNYNLETEDLVMIYKDGSRFTAKLTDKNGNTLKNATVLFTINGQAYTRKTNDEGIASIAINLNSGIYTITTRYQEEFKTNNITIKATVEANDVVKVYRNATQYYAKFTDNAGKVLKNTQVTFNINGVYYTRTTNESGVAKLNLNLQQGKYVLTAINPVTGENAANNITILSTIIENRDITKYYKNATQYTVKLIKPDGSIAGAGEKVTFNINGVFYERTTNESGIAKMNINLNPGNYIITTEYAGCKVSNNIKVLPTIKAQDLTKKYGTPNPFTATLLDGEGKPLANEKISFNINGVFYTRTTDADGIAKLNINLQAGKYIITSSYNGLNVANTVTVH